MKFIKAHATTSYAPRCSIALVVALVATLATGAQTTGSKELRIGILPDADSLPFMVAEEERLFAAESASVRLVRFQSPVERDAAFQAGAVDGIIGDILAAVLAVQGGFDIKISSLTDGRYGIAVTPGSDIRSLAQLAGKPIGISTNTIIQYMVDTYMAKAGVPAAKIQGLAVPRMPVRLEMLLAGQLAAAGMPEPLLTVARIRGARILASTDDSGLRAGVLIFTRSAMDSQLPAIRGMYRAYWKAAQSVNAQPERYRPFLASKAGFPEDAAAAYVFVRYAKPRLPGLSDIEQVMDWMRSRSLLKTTIAAESLLDGRAVSGW